MGECPPSVSRNSGGPIDPRILIIARAIGRLIALEQLGRLRAGNDNGPEEGG
jgi:hypothetical protein